jgi:hypothetical protein
MNVILVRGANGITTWYRQPLSFSTWNWVCNRDGFTVPNPDDHQSLESALLTMAQHSQGLVGTIQQVVQLDI